MTAFKRVAAPRRVVPTRRLPLSQYPRACTQLPPPNPSAVGPPGSRLGRSPRELSHFSDNAGCGLSVSTRFPLRGSRPIPTACRPCRSAGFWPAECDPPRAFALPDYSLRWRCAFRTPFPPCPLQGKARFGVGPAPPAVPFALVGPREPCGCRGSDSDCEAFAADSGPSTAGSTRQYAGSVLSKPLQATLGGRRSGGDSQTRPVRPTSPRPPFTDVPAFRSGRPRVGSRLPFLLHPYRLSPWECTANPHGQAAIFPR